MMALMKLYSAKTCGAFKLVSLWVRLVLIIYQLFRKWDAGRYTNLLNFFIADTIKSFNEAPTSGIPGTFPFLLRNMHH